MTKRKFIGRVELIIDFENILASLIENNHHINFILLRGKYGSGKSFLMDKFKALCRKNKCRTITINSLYFQENESVFSLIKNRLQRFGRKLNQANNRDINFYNVFEYANMKRLTEQMRRISRAHPLLFFIEDVELMSLNLVRLLLAISSELREERVIFVLSLDERRMEKTLFPFASSLDIVYRSITLKPFSEANLNKFLRLYDVKEAVARKCIKRLYRNNLKAVKFILENNDDLMPYIVDYHDTLQFSDIILHLYEKLPKQQQALINQLSLYKHYIPYALFKESAGMLDSLAKKRFITIKEYHGNRYILFYLREIRRVIRATQKPALRNRRFAVQIDKLNTFEGFLYEHYRSYFLAQMSKGELSPRLMDLINTYMKHCMYKDGIYAVLNILNHLRTRDKGHDGLLLTMLQRLYVFLLNVRDIEPFLAQVFKLAQHVAFADVSCYLKSIMARILFLKEQIAEANAQVHEIQDHLAGTPMNDIYCDMALELGWFCFLKHRELDYGWYIDKAAAYLANGDRSRFLRTKLQAREGFMFYRGLQLKKAGEKLLTSLAAAREMGRDDLIADIHNYLGQYYSDSKNMESSWQNYLASAEIFRRIGNLRGEFKPLNNLGTNCNLNNELDKGYYFFSLCMEIARLLDEHESIARIYNNISPIFQQMGDWDKALEYLNKCIIYTRKLANKSLFQTAIYNVILFRMQRGDLILAKKRAKTYKKAIAGTKDIAELGRYYTLMGKLEMYDNNLATGKRYLRKAAELAQKGGNDYFRDDAHLSLYEFYLLHEMDITEISDIIGTLSEQEPADVDLKAFYQRINALALANAGLHTDSLRSINEAIANIENTNYIYDTAVTYLFASVLYRAAYKDHDALVIYDRLSRYYLQNAYKILVNLNAVKFAVLLFSMPALSTYQHLLDTIPKEDDLRPYKRRFRQSVNNMTNKLDMLESFIRSHVATDSKDHLQVDIIELVKDSVYSMKFSFKNIMNQIERDFYQLKETRNSLLDLLAISKEINSVLDKNKLFNAILDSILNILQAERAYIFLFQEGELRPVAFRSINKSKDGRSPEKKVKAMSKESYSNNKFLSGIMELDVSSTLPLSDRKRFYLIIPLNIEKNTIGVLYIDLPQNMAALEESQRKLAELFAEYASTAIDKVRKIDELTRAMEELKTLDRMKSEFITIASHELRTPLVSVKGYIELLLKGYLGNLNARQLTGITHANNNLERLIKIVDDIITIAEIDRGEDSLYKEIFDLNSLVPELTESTKRYVTLRNQHFTTQTAKEPLMVYGDQEKLHRAVYNLIMNAIRFTPDKGHISLRLYRTDNSAAIAVRDDGIGIAKEFHDDIFKRFFEIQSSSYHKSGTFEFLSGGAGLGLPISNAIVALHNGRIEVESEPKKGSCFTIFVPLMELGNG